GVARGRGHHELRGADREVARDPECLRDGREALDRGRLTGLAQVHRCGGATADVDRRGVAVVDRERTGRRARDGDAVDELVAGESDLAALVDVELRARVDL